MPRELHECISCGDVIQPDQDIEYWFDTTALPRFRKVVEGRLGRNERIPDGYTHRSCARGNLSDSREKRACPRCGHTRLVKVTYCTSLTDGGLVRQEWLPLGRKLCTACELSDRAAHYHHEAARFARKAAVARTAQQRRTPSA